MSEGQTRLAPPEGIGALGRQRLDWARLYFVCDARQSQGDLEELLRAALAGGAGIVQLRDKEADREALVRAGHTFKRLAEGYGALFIVNDDPSLASELQADGVHVGQDDLDPSEARRLLGADAVIGVSTHSPEQLDKAQGAGVDYLSAGPVWETPTKQGRPAAGLQLIEHAARASKLPFFAIGGIDPRNVAEVSAAGATRVCVVRAIRDAEDPRAAAAALRAAVEAGTASDAASSAPPPGAAR